MAETLLHPTTRSIPERLAALGPGGRLGAYEDGGLSLAELHTWAALWPEEVPLVNGELPWIVATLADLE
ncbi:MAG: hypothetical protein JST59_30285 [Actinobacteria bacterium]|nr:hypothetical protein [Actinomycetota bacterium]